MTQGITPSPDEQRPDPAATEPPAEPFVVTLPDDPRSQKDWYLWAGVLVLLALVCFLPAVNGTFIWDDDKHVTHNPALENVQGLLHAWVPPIVTPQYYPLTHTTFWVEHMIWGMNPIGYHVVNLLLYAGTAVLIWRLLRRLGVPGAWVIAAIWAVHPMQAETVAWISERKNVLSGLFFFASAWFFLDYAGIDETDPAEAAGRWKLPDPLAALGVSLALFVAALLSKTIACSLPAVLLVVLWWKDRLDARKLLALVPYFVVGLVLALVTVHMETTPGGLVVARGEDWNLSPLGRVLVAGRNFWFYIAKLLLPTRLAFNYPKVEPQSWHVVYVIAALALVGGFWAARDRIGRGPLAAVLYYGLTLFPALGFINVFPFRYSYVADHFQYLSGLGIIALLTAAAATALRRARAAREAAAPAAATTSPARPLAARPAGTADEAAATPGRAALFFPVAVSALVLLAMGLLARQRAEVFTTPIALWRDTLEKNPSSWMAYDNLGGDLVNRANLRLNDAALARESGDTDTSDDLQQQSAADIKEAIVSYQHALALRPVNYTAHTGLGSIYARERRFDDAAAEFTRAIADEQAAEDARPDAQPYVRMGQMLVQEAQLVEDQARARPRANDPQSATTQSAPATQTSVAAAPPPAPTTTGPATLPAALAEAGARAAKLYEQATTYLNQGLDVALNKGMNSPAARPRAVQQAALAYYYLGTARIGLAQYDDAAAAAAGAAGRRADAAAKRADADAKFMDAGRFFNESIKFRPNDPEAHYWEAMCYLRFADRDSQAKPRAEEQLIRAIQLAPGNRHALAYFRMGQLREEQSSAARLDLLDAAIASFDQALQIDPTLRPAAAELARAKAVREQWAKIAATMPSATMPSTTEPSASGPAAGATQPTDAANPGGAGVNP